MFLLSTQLHESELVKKGELEIGQVHTADNRTVSIHAVLGDVFDPRKIRRDLSFDLVAVSYYFDPIRIEKQDVLLRNPLLDSALRNSARDQKELQYFASKIIAGLYQSQGDIKCFTRNPKGKSCEGDQLVPTVWPAYGASTLEHGPKGYRFVTAIPLFDPDALMGKIEPSDARHRLQKNLLVGVRRALETALDSIDDRVRSVGFAALGSTSHRGGDSKAFLEFKTGFTTIIKGLEASRPSKSLDRLYLVAYDRHQLVYREDAINGLIAASQYLSLAKLKEFGPISVFLSALITVLYIVISTIAYQNAGQIIKSNNRWMFFGTISSVCVLLAGFSWGSVIVLSEFVDAADTLYVFLGQALVSSFCILFILWMSRRANWFIGK